MLLGSMESHTQIWSGKRYDCGISQFDNVGENLDSYINCFKLMIKAYELPEIVDLQEFIHEKRHVRYKVIAQFSTA